MKIRFLIAYKTHWGESLQVAISYGASIAKKTMKVVEMSTTDGYCWSGDVELPKSTRRMDYHYQVVCNGMVIRREWTAAGERHLPLDAKERLYTLCDHWRDIPAEAYLYTSAFTESFTRHGAGAPKLVYGGRTLVLRVEAPRLGEGQVLALSGSLPSGASGTPPVPCAWWRRLPTCGWCPWRWMPFREWPTINTSR